ncbi:N(4)-(Beta-N-acetylglucosaminyl)-L-asparaginase-like isoform X3 [Halichondria panicea]|uniref:N(4)-(Beta-N-acetylglucosaminyl)-L-asparaginase- like isoform X3 n=1 Tax=Halichondria panicea TaxID=6063 RepID=UPI00312B9704
MKLCVGCVLLIALLGPCVCEDKLLPVVINTWPFVDANKGAAQSLSNGGSYLDAVEAGCSVCEAEQCDGTVGYGGSPDENGETTLDAMIMDGESHDVGSVGCLRQVKSAISVARSVMERTGHTLLVGELATEFAVEMGFTKEDLQTNNSRKIYTDWRNNKCQPNYWIPKQVTPDPTSTCGPYHPLTTHSQTTPSHEYKRPPINRFNHDTIGMVVVDDGGRIACGTSTNGASHKIPGRVGDSPIVGAGCYVEKGVGGASATGDGDIMMRFLPCRVVVDKMKAGASPTSAAMEALQEIKNYYPSYGGGIIAVNVTGHYGGAYTGFPSFHYTVYNPTLGASTVVAV